MPPRVLPGAEAESEFFMEIPWCRQKLENDQAVLLPRLDQENDGRGSTGQLFSTTLNSPSTISHRVVLFHDPSTSPSPAQGAQGRWLPLASCSVFYALGKGVCGFGDLVHGGIQTTLLDDVMGVLGVLNARLEDGMILEHTRSRWSPELNGGVLDLSRNMFATQGLQVKFARPLRAPTLIQVTANLKGIADDGSSFVVEAAIIDGTGKKYAHAEARWAVIPIRNKL